MEAGAAFGALDVLSLGLAEIVTLPVALGAKHINRHPVRVVIWYTQEGYPCDWLMYECIEPVAKAR